MRRPILAITCQRTDIVNCLSENQALSIACQRTDIINCLSENWYWRRRLLVKEPALSIAYQRSENRYCQLLVREPILSIACQRTDIINCLSENPYWQLLVKEPALSIECQRTVIVNCFSEKRYCQRTGIANYLSKNHYCQLLLREPVSLFVWVFPTQVLLVYAILLLILLIRQIQSCVLPDLPATFYQDNNAWQSC